ncbi:MAG: aminotransferase class V-fold PLP-dependent enzyme [Candidatus Peribacteria bacterium]|nr:MAG: aminotransferase class V-fold PLP-dependent enzyme [Candidatus Peribacteria bacterium]
MDSKKKVAEYIGAENWKEIIYSFNSTYASNLLVTSLRRSGYFQKGDKVLVSIVEHHANVVPWLILAEEVGVEVEYIRVHEDFSLDFEDLASKLDDRVKAVSLTHVSNVTGEIFDLERVNHLLSERYPPLTPPYQGGEENIPPLTRGRQGGGRPLFIVDASQSVPHMAVDVQKIGCDFLFFT